MKVSYLVQRRGASRASASLNATTWRTVRRFRSKDRDEGSHRARLGRFRPPGRYRAVLKLTSLSGKKGVQRTKFRVR